MRTRGARAYQFACRRLGGRFAHVTPGRRGGRSGPIARSFRNNESGAVAVYVALVSVALIGALVLGLDIGRLVTVQTQMQNAADAAATAAAIKLDGFDGARARATTVAKKAADPKSGFLTKSGNPDIEIDQVTFFSEYTPGGKQTVATSDGDAMIVKVTVVPRNVSLLLEPAFAALAGSTAQRFTELNALAVAGNYMMMCDPPPLMICNPVEIGLIDVTTTAAIGRQVKLRMAGNSPAPGNFGLLCPPIGGGGAPDVEAFLAQPNYDECVASGLETKTGVVYTKVNNGINARFDIGKPKPLGDPARNVTVFVEDDSFAADMLGDGMWDANAYWDVAHDHDGDSVVDVGHEFPAAALADATRYQVYLYELNETYAHPISAFDPPLTIYPVDDCTDLPTGFACVNPPGLDLPVNGAPPVSPPGVADARRRVMKAAVVRCVSLGIKGKTNIPMNQVKLIEIFISEPADGDSATTSPIVGEILGQITMYNPSGGILNNVNLIE